MQNSKSQPSEKPTTSRNCPVSPNSRDSVYRPLACMQDLPLRSTHPRFEVTPKSIGLNILSSQLGEQNETSKTPAKSGATTKVLPQSCCQSLCEEQMEPHKGSSSKGARPECDAHTPRSSYMGRRSSSLTSPLSPETSYSRPVSDINQQSSVNGSQMTLISDHSQLPQNQDTADSMQPNESQCFHSPNESILSADSLIDQFKILPAGHFEQQIQKFRSGSNIFTTRAAEINGQLNEIFVKRLKDIDDNAYGDNNLKLITYQEWVDMLLKINESILTNVEELESEVAKRLEYTQTRVNVNCRNSQGNEIMKCRKDIDLLLKVTQNAYHSHIWDFSVGTFETVTPAQVLGLTEEQYEKRDADGEFTQMENSPESDVAQKNKKLLANMKALAFEVAEKHDEVRDLKRQVACLEDDIQKAHKKIQFKDDVIKELRNDLKRNGKSASSTPTVDGSLVMPPINHDLDTPRNNAANQPIHGNQAMIPEACNFQLGSLSQTQLLEQHQISVLSEEFNQLMEISHAYNNQKAEQHRACLTQFFLKSENEKLAAYRKLDFLRRHLIDLENSALASPAATEQSVIDDDSGFSSKSEHDQDVKILEGVRKRLRALNETSCELKDKIQKLERDNTELETSLKLAENMSQRNDAILKEVAKLICDMTNNPICDTHKDESQFEVNPLCAAILDMKRTYQEKEAHFMTLIRQKSTKIDELTQALIKKEKVYNEPRTSISNISEGEDIDNITPPASLSMQPLQMTLLKQQLLQTISQEKEKTDTM